LKHLSFKTIPYKKTQFSKVINALDAPDSKLDGFLYRDTCVSSTQRSRPVWSKKAFLHLRKYDLQEVFLSKNNSVLTGKQ
jgi:hypothetical protein